MRLSCGFLVEIGMNDAIRVSSLRFQTAIAVNPKERLAAICHPNARLLLTDGKIDVISGNRITKITERGVMFKCLDGPLAYMVDESGCKTVANERFQCLTACEITSGVLQEKALYGKEAKIMAHNAMTRCTKDFDSNGSVIWKLANYKIHYHPKGDLTISLGRGDQKIFMSFGVEGQVKIKMDFYKLAAGTCFVNAYRMQKEDLNMVQSGIRIRDSKLTARFDNQSAGLDRYDCIFIK